MIIRSIRLKNIKSYGEGDGGEGITIEFAPGINRIAGRNGHGKSTLIESLGYALFLTPPLFEETVQVATYLLRAGEKAGEIDVTFEHDGEVYRIERGLGLRSTRRSKVVQLGDSSIAAEGDHEVSAFLCRLLDCSDPERLSELFAKLVGVKQGRLAWPFDSKPTEARKHFEPLLDVEIFRQCFDRLKPVIDEFSQAGQEEATRLATAAERVRDRQDAPERVKTRRLEVKGFGEAVEVAKTSLKNAEAEKLRWEAIEKTWRSLRDTHEKSRSELELAKTRRENAEISHAEAIRAATAVGQTEEGHKIYLLADRALSALHQQQEEKSRLEQKRAQVHALRVEYDTKSAAAAEAADDCEKRRNQFEQRAAELEREASELGKNLANSAAAFATEGHTIEQLRRDEGTMRHWTGGLPEKTRRLAELGATIEKTRQAIASWDVALFEQVRAKEQLSRKALEEINGQLAAAAEGSRSLKQQLEEIAGGVCPFLKDRCNQFDPAKVASDLHTRETTIIALTTRESELKELYRVAKTEADRLVAADSKLTHLRADLDGRTAELQSGRMLLMPPEIRECSERLGLQAPALPDELNGEIPAWLVSVRAFSTAMSGAFEELASQLKRRFKAFEETQKSRLRDEHHLATLEKDSASTKKEVHALAEGITAKRKEAQFLRVESEREAKAMAETDNALKAFAALSEQIAEEQRRKTLHHDSYQRYLAAKPLADKLDERQRAVEELKSVETAANLRLEAIAQQLRTAAEAVDPAAIENAGKAFLERATESRVAEEKLAHCQRELDRDEVRLAEFEKSSVEKAKIETEISRIKAAIELTEKARGILKNAAPHVAQHLCQRIAGRAQQIFNYINHEPSELEWSSDRYGLRIHPGDRRFAMLSGGEQTKLALAMTLAMIQEFCGLKFCVFDEPTYGVDGDSRLKLADAILAAQEAAGFDQLLLVSHDDAFDGRIEHTVRLSKTATGTHPVVE